MQRAEVNLWALSTLPDDTLTTFKWWQQRLTGQVKRHPKVKDGDLISGPVLLLDLDNFTASTKNTVYDLGQPEPAFVEQMRRERPDIFAKITAHMVQPV